MDRAANLLRRVCLVVALLAATLFATPGFAAVDLTGPESCAEGHCLAAADQSEASACAECLGPCATGGCHAHQAAILLPDAPTRAVVRVALAHPTARAVTIHDHRPAGLQRPPRA